ncbi:endonuclease IV [Hydrogenivirga caldilitoris]|uniref:Probable endonuclease 4 n=1 Tax=Hydrogenivirga caldilitoris TaxID=246264 RepID=A0A497XRA3_9AQUI|nr:deoxyribonuclease IV [Hydrogenivirga caldilitoris]RLJ71557.1 endonuclease IV [Hydrogenivirga caldilitoris]
MALFGAHVSSAGSILKTFDRAKEVTAEVFQFFLRSPRAWRWKGVSNELVNTFSQELQNFGKPVMVHAPYLLNLASADLELRNRSISVFLEELELCDRAGIHFYNFHPGTAKGISEEEALRNIVSSLERVFNSYEPKTTTVLLENTAGERGDMGKNFSELKEIIDRFPGVKLGVCIDTCHAFAYGYEINKEVGFSRFLSEIERTIGFDRIKAIHANDSKVPLGGRRDRHEHIGEGFIGYEGFRNFLRHEYLRELPYYIETPKTGGMDIVNLNRLREIYSL